MFFVDNCNFQRLRLFKFNFYVQFGRKITDTKRGENLSAWSLSEDLVQTLHFIPPCLDFLDVWWALIDFSAWLSLCEDVPAAFKVIWSPNYAVAQTLPLRPHIITSMCARSAQQLHKEASPPPLPLLFSSSPHLSSPPLLFLLRCFSPNLLLLLSLSPPFLSSLSPLPRLFFSSSVSSPSSSPLILIQSSKKWLKPFTRLNQLWSLFFFPKSATLFSIHLKNYFHPTCQQLHLISLKFYEFIYTLNCRDKK